MAIEILMPALSPTMEEGTLAKWLVKEGDTVKSGQIIAEIETDKATMEFEAVDEGTVGKLLVAEGTSGVKVNAPIATLISEGESADAAPAAAAPAPAEVAMAAAPARRAAACPAGHRTNPAAGNPVHSLSHGDSSGRPARACFRMDRRRGSQRPQHRADQQR